MSPSKAAANPRPFFSSPRFYRGATSGPRPRSADPGDRRPGATHRSPGVASRTQRAFLKRDLTSVCRLLIGRLLIGSAGGGGHVQPLVCPRGTTFLEHGNGARLIAGFPEPFGDVSIDHAGGACPDRGVGQAQRPFGAAEAAFRGSAVAVEYLVLGKRAVSQRKRPAVEPGGARALVGPGESLDLFLCQTHCRLVVAAVGRLQGVSLVGSAGAGCQHRCTRRDPDDVPATTACG